MRIYDKKSKHHDIPINAEIIRLNIIAAKLRAEAAKLQAFQQQIIDCGLEEVFKSFDTDNDGLISIEELKAGLMKTLETGVATEEQASKIMETFDISEDGSMESEELQGADSVPKNLDLFIKEAHYLAQKAETEAQKLKLLLPQTSSSSSSVSSSSSSSASSQLSPILQAWNAQFESTDNRLPTVTERYLASLLYILPLLDILHCNRYLSDAIITLPKSFPTTIVSNLIPIFTFHKRFSPFLDFYLL